MKKTILMAALAVVAGVFLTVNMGDAAKKAEYVGYKKCGGCHKSQKDSWLESSHAKAFEDLEKGVKVAEKKKAGLEDKDYTKDEKCLTCHTTGYGEKGGYKEDLGETTAKYLVGVTCEMCHGAGEGFRKEHRKAGNEFKKTNKPTPRKNLVALGQNVSTEDIKEACFSCHMNYEGSGWNGAKEPYTPFTPKVDAKYKFDFDKAVKDTKAMHEHFKLRGVFTGEPLFKYREAFQKEAKEAVEGEEGGEEK